MDQKNVTPLPWVCIITKALYADSGCLQVRILRSFRGVLLTSSTGRILVSAYYRCGSIAPWVRNKSWLVSILKSALDVFIFFLVALRIAEVRPSSCRR